MHWRWWCGCLLLGQALSALAQAPQPRPGAPLLIDTQRSQLGFEVRTRIGQRLQGVFPVYEGICEVLPDGRHQVRLRLSTAAAEIPDKPRYTAWMRGDSFFDVLRHPWMELVSEPYQAETLADGGELVGRLTLRGNSRAESLRIGPAECARPGLDCPIAVNGDIARSRYGMDDWQIAVGDRVLLRMQVWLKDNPAP